MAEETIPNGRHRLHVLLNDGFRNHTVALSVDGREVYFRTGVTTDPATSLADAVAIPVVYRTAHLSLSAAPGGLVGSVEVDVIAHPELSISLVGDGTVSFEIRSPHGSQD